MDMNMTNDQPQSVLDEQLDDNVHKYLSFSVCGEDYGIPILRVREILVIVDITPLPQSKPHVKGVINLRGRIIPVIDIRRIFNMPQAEYTAETCVIVVEVSDGSDDEHIQMGVIVDKVNEVVNIEEENIDQTPDFGYGCNNAGIRGMGKIPTGVVIILNIDKVLSHDETKIIDSNSDKSNCVTRTA